MLHHDNSGLHEINYAEGGGTGGVLAPLALLVPRATGGVCVP